MAETLDEFHVALDLLVLIPVSLDLALVDFFTLLQIGGVVPSVRNELHRVGIDFDDGLDHCIHEITIMGDHENGA